MELIKYPNEFLDKKVKPFDWENLDSEKIEQEMISIMMNSDGIGLAANQVSLDARVFTILLLAFLKLELTFKDLK